MMRSRLTFRAVTRHAGRPMIALGRSLDVTERFACSLHDGTTYTLVGPYGARYEGAMELVERGWFHHVPEVAGPEPASFAYSLREVERFADDVVEQLAPTCPSPVFFGAHEAASLVLALATLCPDRFSAVIAMEGALPIGNTWGITPADLAGLRFLLVSARDEVAETCTALARAGADVTVRDAPSGTAAADATATEVRRWLEAAEE